MGDSEACGGRSISETTPRLPLQGWREAEEKVDRESDGKGIICEPIGKNLALNLDYP